MSRPSGKELIEQTKELMDGAQWFAPVAEDGGNIEGNVHKIAARIEAVIALHEDRHGYCNTCGGKWPCLTLRLLDGVNE